MQSASFPGSEVLSKTDFLVVSLAFFAASLALAANIALSQIIFPIEGFSFKNSEKLLKKTLSTIPLTSLFPSLVLV